MAPINYIENQLIEEFKNSDSISRDELFTFYRRYEPDLKESTFGWRIYDLKRKNKIKVVRKGVYTLEIKKTFRPDLDRTILQIARILESSFDYHQYNIWSTSWLNEMIELQLTSFMIILETDKDSLEGAFHRVKDGGFPNSIFLKPNEAVISTYVSEVRNPVILKPMVSRAPVMKIQNIIVPTLEKILVDLYCEEKLFYAFQGNQLIRIYTYCFEKYLVNLSRMLSYARRRKREGSLKEFLTNDLKDKIKDIIE